MKQYLLTAALLVSFVTAQADEGMWMLTDLKKQNAAAMQELGLLIPVESVYNPDSISLKDAVVQFGGGCTGEIISSEGLVLTNHHCGYPYIQQHSSVDHDYLTDGFVARNRNEELPCQGLSVTFIDRVMDITSFVEEQLLHDPDPQGTNYLSPKYLQEVAERFALTEGIAIGRGGSLELKPFYGGNKYYLFIKKTYRDIRMVLAPPSSIGKFGADTDNWMWPRHTGDFSLFRIYAAPNGEPADYSTANMPLHVKQHLRISLEGYTEGDFAFVMGFPGHNWRYMISDEVKERMETTNFMRIHVRDARQQLLMQAMQADDATRIHYAAVYARSANYWKNALGMNEGLVKLNVLDAKRTQEQELLQWEAAQGDTACAAAYRTIESIVARRHPALYHQQAIQEAFITGMDFMRIPSTTGLATALKKKDEKYIRRATDSLRMAADRYFQSVPFPEVERKVAKEMMRVYMRYIPAEQRISIFQIIGRRFKGDSDKFIDACLKHSIFGSRENFNEFIAKPTLRKLETDWMVLFKYSNRDNNSFDDIFWIDGTQQFFYLRVEGGFKPEGYLPQVSNEQYRNQRQEIIELYSMPYDQWQLTIGDAEGVPVWVLRMINRILSLSHVEVNGRLYVRSEASVPEKTQTLEGRPLFQATASSADLMCLRWMELLNAQKRSIMVFSWALIP